MRTLLKVTPDVEAANKAIQSGEFGRIMGELAEMIQPEASYFLTEQGRRTALYVFDMKDPSQMPQIAENLFIVLKAEVEFTPVMNQEELGRGMEASAESQHAAV